MQIRRVLSPAGSKRVRPHSPRWDGGRGRGLEARQRVRSTRGCVHAHVAETPRGGPPLAACKRRAFRSCAASEFISKNPEAFCRAAGTPF